MENKNEKISISLYLNKTYRLLNKSLRYKGFLILCLIIFLAFLETATVGVISLFASSLTNPQEVINSKYIKFIVSIYGMRLFDSNSDIFIFLGALTVLMVALKNSIKGFYLFISTRYIAGIEGYIGERLLENILYLPYSWHLNKNRSNLVLAVSTWRVSLGRGFLHPTMTIAADTFVVLIMFLSLIIIQPLVSLSMIAIVGSFGWLFFTLIKKSLDKASRENRDIERRIHKESVTAVHGVKDVKISGTESFFVARYARLVMRAAGKQGFIAMLGEAPALILEATGFAALCVTVLIMIRWGGYSTAYITGTVALLAVTAWRVLPAVTRIISCLTRLRSSLSFLEKMFGYLDTAEEPEAGLKTRTQSEQIMLSDDIRLENLTFSYNGKKVFDKQSLIIPKNSITGIIGSSGSGKSTMIDIITGCLFPDEGELKTGSITIDRENLSLWRRLFGYVPQEPYFYDGTLAENVAFGIPENELDFDLISRCCEMSAMEFIDDLSDGLNTWIGDDGVRLSGGQRQRLAIARALYRNPEIIVFDEATSSLDLNTEKEILETIYGLKGNRTILMISHNLDSVMLCDSLIWIENGKIIMQGSPDIVAASFKAEKTRNTVNLKYEQE